MADVSPKVLELIAKLHALATNKAATEAEASTALAKMQKLLFDHNISISDINLTPEKRKAGITDEGINSGDIIQRWFGSRIRANERQWPVQLASLIARYNFCSTMMSRDFSHVWFVGTPTNIEAVKEIWLYAVEQVMALADAGYKEYRRSGGTVYYRIWRRNFSNGCVIRLGERLMDEWHELQQANVDSKALIVVNSTDLAEYVESKVKGRAVKYRYGKQPEGQGAGYSAGDLVELGAKKKQLA